jgi:hypothetical protein
MGHAYSPVIQVQSDDVTDAIHKALIEIRLDIVVDQNGVLVANYDNHLWKLNKTARIMDCLCWHLNFINNNGKRIDPPTWVCKAFVKQALEEHWFKQAYRGPCPFCAWREQNEQHKIK